MQEQDAGCICPPSSLIASYYIWRMKVKEKMHRGRENEDFFSGGERRQEAGGGGRIGKRQKAQES